MKDMSEDFYVIDIKIDRDRSQEILGLSQETFIIERFCMKNYSPCVAPIVKGDKFNSNQCPSNYLVKEFCFRASDY